MDTAGKLSSGYTNQTECLSMSLRTSTKVVCSLSKKVIPNGPLNPFLPNITFQYPLKKSENR